MSAYLLSVVGTVLFSAILTMVTPEGKTSVIIKAATRLACLVVILFPILNFFQTGRLFEINFASSGIRSDVKFIEYCSKINVENAENLLKEEIEKEFEFPCEVRLLWEEVKESENGYEFFKIKIIKAEIVGEFDESTAEKIKAFIQKVYSCDAEVLLSG